MHQLTRLFRLLGDSHNATARGKRLKDDLFNMALQIFGQQRHCLVCHLPYALKGLKFTQQVKQTSGRIVG